MSKAFKKMRELVGKHLSAQEIFTSNVFGDYMNSLTKIVSSRYKTPIMLRLEWEEEKEDVAYTDNREIYINLGTHLVQNETELNNKYLMYLGLLAHELGHVLYTDFALMLKSIDAFENKTWCPERPRFTDPEDVATLESFERFLFDKYSEPALMVVAELYKAIDNILEDRYINERMKKEYPGNFKAGLDLLSRQMKAELMQNIKDSESKADTVINYMLYACYANTVPEYVLKEYPVLNKILAVVKEIDNVHAPSDRLRLSNEVLILLWAYFEQECKDKLEKINQIIEALQQLRQSVCKSMPFPMDEQEQQGQGSGKEKSKGQQSEGQDSQNNSRQSIERQLQELANALAQELGGNQQGKRQTSQMGSGRGICCEQMERQSQERKQGSSGSQQDVQPDDSDEKASGGTGQSDGVSDKKSSEKKSGSKRNTKNDLNADDSLESKENGETGEKDSGPEKKNNKFKSNDDFDDDFELDDDYGNVTAGDEESEKDSAEKHGADSEDEDAEKSTSSGHEGKDGNSDSQSEANGNNTVEGNDSSSDVGDVNLPDDYDLSGDVEIHALDNPLANIDSSTFSKTIDELLNEVTKEITRKQPETVQELERYQSCEEVQNGDYHRGVPCTIITPNVSHFSYAKKSYDKVFAPLKGISKRLQRSINDALEDKREGGTQKGLLFGNKVNPAATAYGDGKVFKRNRLPEDYPFLAVSILIDESGSMNGRRIQYAMQTAMILEDFCRGLDIPISIVGHSVRGAGVTLCNYIDFDDTSANAKYRLTNMMAAGCNRDGFALRYCINRLKEREEPTKLLILISDGRPSDYDYGDSIAEADLKDAQKLCKKHDITLFAAAIGEDKPHIQKIYGNSFLDITDLTKLPEKMVTLVRRFVD